MYWKIQYDANGGTVLNRLPNSFDTIELGYSGSTSIIIGYARENIITISSYITRTGYDFDGWGEQAGVKQYNDGASVTISSGGPGSYQIKKFYVYWKPHTYNVTYNKNDGTGTTVPDSVNYPLNYTFKDTTAFTRAGYTLKGWSTSSGSTTIAYTLGQLIQSYANNAASGWYANTTIPVYAIWELPTLTYNTNGIGTITSVSASAGSTITLPNPTAIGYKFIKWSLYLGNGSIKPVMQFLNPNVKPGIIAATSGLTISFWYKLISYVENAGFFYICSGPYIPSNLVNIRIIMRSNVLEFMIVNKADSKSYTSSINPSNGTWNHIVWSISTTGVWTIYHNNINLGVNITYSLGTETDWNANMDDYRLGYWDYNGYIDGFSIYNKVLTNTEIAEIYNSGSFLANNIVAFYGFDDNTQSNWLDSSGNGYHITSKSASTQFSNTEYVQVIPNANYNANSAYTMPASDTTLYANWEETPIRLTDIKNKFNPSGTGPISLKAYYNNAGLVSGVSGIPTSGAIDMTLFKGAKFRVATSKSLDMLSETMSGAYMSCVYGIASKTDITINGLEISPNFYTNTFIAEVYFSYISITSNDLFNTSWILVGTINEQYFGRPSIAINFTTPIEMSKNSNNNVCIYVKITNNISNLIGVDSGPVGSVFKSNTELDVLSGYVSLEEDISGAPNRFSQKVILSKLLYTAYS